MVGYVRGWCGLMYSMFVVEFDLGKKSQIEFKNKLSQFLTQYFILGL